MKTDKDFQKRANRHGRSCVASMRDDLAALHHAEECNGTTASGRECKRGNETRKLKLSNGSTVNQMRHEHPEAWHSEAIARDVIAEGHYGIEVRDGWRRLGEVSEGAEEYIVVLGGGGPASRVRGKLDGGEPQTAVYEFQDWFKPWTPAVLSEKDEATLLEWVQQLYFGD